jgi:rSAM/selenodomain-associated transferase 1
MFDATVIVLAKEPVPGRAKTRLCPPCTPDQAARLASAALTDTLVCVAGTPARRRVLAFDGDGERWRPDGFELIAQRGDGLAARLAAAFEDTHGPALLVGMDTPQLTPQLLTGGLRALTRPDIDTVFGPTLDGGYWCAGLKTPRPELFAGVPMSSVDTWTVQRARIRSLGLSLCEQPWLRDVDTFDDARAVALQAPRSRFAEAIKTL